MNSSGLKGQLIRFLLGGGVGVVVYWSALYCVTEFLGQWWLVSAIVGFFLNVAVNFTIMKFWTFQNNITHRVTVVEQLRKYLTMKTVLFILNMSATYLLVQKAQFHYLFAQGLAGSVHVVCSFVTQRRIFRKN